MAASRTRALSLGRSQFPSPYHQTKETVLLRPWAAQGRTICFQPLCLFCMSRRGSTSLVDTCPKVGALGSHISTVSTYRGDKIQQLRATTSVFCRLFYRCLTKMPSGQGRIAFSTNIPTSFRSLRWPSSERAGVYAPERTSGPDLNIGLCEGVGGWVGLSRRPSVRSDGATRRVGAAPRP
jgi:hypothetical protein